MLKGMLQCSQYWVLRKPNIKYDFWTMWLYPKVDPLKNVDRTKEEKEENRLKLYTRIDWNWLTQIRFKGDGIRLRSVSDDTQARKEIFAIMSQPEIVLLLKHVDHQGSIEQSLVLCSTQLSQTLLIKLIPHPHKYIRT